MGVLFIWTQPKFAIWVLIELFHTILMSRITVCRDLLETQVLALQGLQGADPVSVSEAPDPHMWATGKQFSVLSSVAFYLFSLLGLQKSRWHVLMSHSWERARNWRHFSTRIFAADAARIHQLLFHLLHPVPAERWDMPTTVRELQYIFKMRKCAM